MTGEVTIQLFADLVRQVDGATGGSRNAMVEYSGDRYTVDNVVLSNIAGLSVKSGSLAPAEGSSFSGTGASVSVTTDTSLGLKHFSGTPVIGDFSGGGSLYLDPDQTLVITGSVSGSTTVIIGGNDPFHSSDEVKKDHAYIRTTDSSEGSFTLAPPSSDSSMELSYDEAYGAWITTSESEQGLLERFTLVSATVTEDEYSAELPLVPTFATGSDESSSMNFIPLDITINDTDVTREEYPDNAGSYIYTMEGLSIEILSNQLYIYSGDPLSGSYAITVTVPGEYTVSGEDLTCSATLTVVKAGEDGIFKIPVPEAIKGLIYTGYEQFGVPEGVGYYIEDSEDSTNTGTDAGEYTAAVSLNISGSFQWDDGTSKSKTISWIIGQADGPAAPAGLVAVAPSASGSDDGKIIGTTSQMEYDTDHDFSQPTSCDAGEITGLTAGTTYYIRIKTSDSNNYAKAESAVITIPEALSNSSIVLNSTAHKTAYTLGDALDVSGLSIKVTRSDGSTRIIVVTENMVDGFDSSSLGQKTLTITYDGLTTTYEVTVGDVPATVYTIDVSASPAAGGSVSGGGTFGENASVTVTASANSGYQFVKWTEEEIEVSTDASYTFTATADRTLTAVFEETAESETTKIVQTALTEVPEGLKNTSFDTVDKIKDELIRILTTNPVYTAADTAIYDVKLQISTDGGKTWTDATEDNFPAGGITVTMPYPSGTGKTTHDFAVTHMFTLTSEKLGTVAGQTEQPTVMKTDEGIRVTLKGLSPIGIAWKAISGGSDDGNGSSGGDDGSSGNGGSSSGGDSGSSDNGGNSSGDGGSSSGNGGSSSGSNGSSDNGGSSSSGDSNSSGNGGSSSGGNSSSADASATYCTLTFDTNGGSPIENVTGKYGDTVNLSVFVPIRNGYSFGGWYSDKELTTPITSIVLTGNKTVYAGWTENGQISSGAGTTPSAATSSNDSASAQTQQTSSPNTGDSLHMGMWLLIFCIFACATAALLIFNRHEERNNKR